MAQAVLLDGAARALPAQFRALTHWPDGSIKWLLVDARVSAGANSAQRLTLARTDTPMPTPAIEVRETGEAIHVATGRAVFELPLASSSPIAAVTLDGTACLDARGLVLRVAGASGADHAVRFTRTLKSRMIS